MYQFVHPSISQFRRLLAPLAAACALQMASAATITYPIYFGHITEADTLINLGTGGGGGTNGTRLGIATAATTGTNPRVAAGTSNTTLFTISEAGTITLTYYLDNTVAAAFQNSDSAQGLYDASSGIASSASALRTELDSFNTLSGLTVSYSGTLPGNGSGGTGAPAQLWTATYTIEEGSAAIGKTVALGFHSTWSNQGAYIFGSEAGANNAVLTFTPIPEPSSIVSLALGAAVILRRRRL
ncbi:MAG: PEP-CTERM sorting domain-containing protein [Luteolibacter sp.]